MSEFQRTAVKRKLELPTAPPLFSAGPRKETVRVNMVPRAHSEFPLGPEPKAAGPRTLNVPLDHDSIQKAIDAARSGDTVLVHPGRYQELIILKNGLHLRGTDRDLCVLLRAHGADTVISVAGCSSGTISSLTVSDDEALISDIEKWLPDGISISNSHIEVLGCRVHRMPGVGILVSGIETAAKIQANLCHENGQNGIDFTNGAQGLIEDNLLERNKDNGLAVSGMGTTPRLRSNRVRSNENCGMLYEDGGGGVAERNLVEGNKKNGVSVSGAGTMPTIFCNNVSENMRTGILFRDGACGLAEENECQRNHECGIAAFDEGTAPTIKGNKCCGNGRSGIYFGRSAGGQITKNALEGNNGNGISVFNAGTNPVISSNICRNNGACGIWTQTSAAANTAKDNVTSGNKKGGIKRGS